MGVAMFSSEVSLRGGSCRRVSPRTAVAYPATFGTLSSATRSPCRIIDISSGGARLRLYADIAPDTKIRLSLPGARLVDAYIVWADGREAGCRFDTPLEEAVITSLIASARC